jgi:sugar-specific transcriptional regulator TrmB
MMIRGAEKTLTIVTTSDGLNRKIESLKPSIEKAKKRGVKVRIAAPITPKNVKVAKEINRFAEVRNVKGVRARFIISDSKELMFMILNDEEVHPTYDVGVWVNTQFFAGALEQLFEYAWQKMRPVGKVKVK